MHRGYEVRPIDLSSLAKETSVMFASDELVEMAACCLEKITTEMKKEEAEERHASSFSHMQKAEKEESSQQVTSEATEAVTEDLVIKPPVPMQKLQSQPLLQNRRLLNRQMPSHPMRRQKTLIKVFLSQKSPRHGLTEWSTQAIVFCGHRALRCL